MTCHAEPPGARRVTNANLASIVDMRDKLQAMLASDEFRPILAFDEARAALSNSVGQEAADGAADSMGEGAADKAGDEIDAAKQITSVVLDIWQNPAIALPGVDVKQADQPLGSDLAGMGADILADTVGGMILQGGIAAIREHNAREADPDHNTRRRTRTTTSGRRTGTGFLTCPLWSIQRCRSLPTPAGSLR